MILQKPNFLRSHPSRSHQATPPAPRFESSGCSPNGALGERNANCSHNLKVANPARLVPLTFSGGSDAKRRWGDGTEKCSTFQSAPQRGPGAAPRHAFGDFRRETKVTRVPSMARPCSRGAPPRGECRGAAPLAYRATQGPPPLQSPRGGPQSPSTYTPKRTKSCIPTCNSGKEKNKKRKPPCFSAGPVLYSI